VGPEVGAVGGGERDAEVLEGEVGGVVDVLLLQHDAVGAAALLRVDGTDAATLASDADHWFLGHRYLGDHEADRRVVASEGDAGRLADGASSAVATHDVVASQDRAVGERDVDATIVLAEPDDLVAHEDRHTELVDPTGEDAFEVALPQREAVVVAGGEVADVEGDVGVALDLHHLPLGEEAVDDASLVEHLQGARVQAAGPRAVELPSVASLDDDGIDPGQCQLPGQHQPGGAATGDHDCVVGHRLSLDLAIASDASR
jgi:hypothetical protein